MNITCSFGCCSIHLTPLDWHRGRLLSLPCCAMLCCRVHDEKETTVYKRALEVQYQLKLKVSG